VRFSTWEVGSRAPVVSIDLNRAHTTGSSPARRTSTPSARTALAAPPAGSDGGGADFGHEGRLFVPPAAGYTRRQQQQSAYQALGAQESAARRQPVRSCRWWFWGCCG
jgi:hypothetical protein